MLNSTKFMVYAQVRATRQLAGDIASTIKQVKGYIDPESKIWDDVESALLDLESKLENLDLTEDNHG